MAVQVDGVIVLGTLVHGVQAQILFMTAINVLFVAALLVMIETRVTVVLVVHNL